MVKNLPGNAGDARDLGQVSRLGRAPGLRKWQPTPVFLPGEFHGKRSLAGYSPWGHKESDTTEHARMTAPPLFSCLFLPHSVILVTKLLAVLH